MHSPRNIKNRNIFEKREGERYLSLEGIIRILQATNNLELMLLGVLWLNLNYDTKRIDTQIFEIVAIFAGKDYSVREIL